MNVLTLDFGNTSAHAALFVHHELVEAGVLADVFSWLEKRKLTYGEVSGVLSAVKSYDEELAGHLKEGLLIDRVKDYWKGQKFAGMPVNYSNTLGEDRLIAAWYCFKILKKPLLHISSGTFFTIDIIDADGFQGGFILPGLSHQLEALNRGAQLSVTEVHPSTETLTLARAAQNTEEALQGIFVSYAQLILKLTQRHNLEEIIINGGAAEQTQRLIKPLISSLKISTQPELNHHALYEWYRRNICL